MRTYSPVVIALSGLTALALPMGIGRFAFTPILPMMQDDAGLSIAAGAWLASANYFGTLLGALFAMVTKLPIPMAIRGGLLVIGVTTLGMGLADEVPVWIILRLFAGFATGWVLPFASAWALDRLVPLRRPLLNAAVFAGYGVGIAAAGGVSIVLMHVNANSAQAWETMGALSLAVTALVWPIFRPDDAGGFEQDQKPTDRCRGSYADSVRLVACYGVFGFGYIIPATFLPVMARQAIQDPSIFGWAWPVFGAAAAASTFAAAGFLGTIGHRALWAFGHIVMAIGVVFPVIWPGIVAIMLSALLVGSMFTVITMAGFQEGREVGGTRMIAAMASAFAVGQIVGPIAVSVVVRADGSFAAALVIACLLLAGSAWAISQDGHTRASAQ